MGDSQSKTIPGDVTDCILPTYEFFLSIYQKYLLYTNLHILLQLQIAGQIIQRPATVRCWSLFFKNWGAFTLLIPKTLSVYQFSRFYVNRNGSIGFDDKSMKDMTVYVLKMENFRVYHTLSAWDDRKRFSPRYIHIPHIPLCLPIFKSASHLGNYLQESESGLKWLV